MEHVRFWSLIDEARGNAKALVKLLAALPGDEIAAFDAWFWAYYMAVRREDLWAAVSAIRGGCGDDGFDYFRGWLIGRGEQAVLAAIRDPESLATLIGGSDPRNEALLGAARVAYKQAGAGELPDAATVEIPDRAAWPADRVAPGTKWKPAFYATQFPALYARYIEPTLKDLPSGSITHERFWEIVTKQITTLTKEEHYGYDRWLTSYNQALMRNDIRAACRVLLGDDALETALEFRGWLIRQGRAVVEAAVRDLDSLLDVAREPAGRAREVIAAGRSIPDDDDWEPIPGRDKWTLDWAEQAPFSVKLLRERLPRLTANRPDDELQGSVNPASLSTHQRQQRAEQLLERGKGYAQGGHDQAALEAFDEAARLWRGNAAILAARARVQLRLGNSDAALRDFDGAIAVEPGAFAVIFERAKLKSMRGDRVGALEDGRKAALRIPDAKAWVSVAERMHGPGLLKRVRHSTFGEGTVISASDGKLVIDFPSGRKTLAERFVTVID